MKKLLLFFKLQLFLIFSGFIFISKASSDSVEALVKKYPTGSILSYSKAKSVLIEINPARIMIKENYATDRIKCFKRFFMSSCLNKIKDKRRVKLSSIRKIEVEAKAFLKKKELMIETKL